MKRAGAIWKSMVYPSNGVLVCVPLLSFAALAVSFAYAKNGNALTYVISESKYFATAAKMDKAFMALLEKKDFAHITVKELCETAGVNRSTFYLHYETVNDLLTESVERMTEQFVNYMKKDTKTFITKLQDCPMEELYLITPEYLTPYLHYVWEYKRLFRTQVEHAETLGLDKSYERLFRYAFTPILERFRVPEKERGI